MNPYSSYYSRGRVEYTVSGQLALVALVALVNQLVYQTVLKPTDRNLSVLLLVQYRLSTTSNTSLSLA